MVSLQIYDFIHIILAIFTISSLLITFFIFVQKKSNQIINGITLGLFSLVTIAVSAITVIIAGYVGDEISEGGDSISLIMFIIILLLCILNGFIYTTRLKKFT
ncbi:hypothetical protein [Lysinibacillus capsici]|uniref:hypothetical protein n=1 Tax=Lysinibacillus capsici TaxID=2115968 RepID=UPI002480EF33|nr:hypothetical protein [Lysinibacillus capsici]